MRYLSSLYLCSVDLRGYFGFRARHSVFGFEKCTLVLTFFVLPETELFTALATFAAFLAAAFFLLPFSSAAGASAASSVALGSAFFPFGAIALLKLRKESGLTRN